MTMSSGVRPFDVLRVPFELLGHLSEGDAARVVAGLIEAGKVGGTIV